MGYKGNKFSFSKNDIMYDNIPCPYYFLVKISKILRNKNFKVFLDLGCGSGRVIYFFNKTIVNKNYIGIEYFSNQFEYCKREFSKQENIKLVQADFTKYDFLKYKADCYFFNRPLINDTAFFELVKKTINSPLLKRNALLIFVNCNNNILKTLKNIQCIETYSINDRKGYSMYYVNTENLNET